MKSYLPMKFLDFFGNFHVFSHTEEVQAAFPSNSLKTCYTSLHNAEVWGSQSWIMDNTKKLSMS